MPEKIKITFLGTSQSIPTASRNHTSIHLNYKDENILIDCGEGTQRQFKKAKLNPMKLTRLLITHWHGDHILGIPGLLQTLSLNNYEKTLKIYGPKGTKHYMNQLIKLFLPREKINLEINEINNKVFETKDFIIEAHSLEHNTPTRGYAFIEKIKLRLDKKKLKKLKLTNIQLKAISEGKNIKHNNKTIKNQTLTYQQPTKKISFIFDTKKCEGANKLAKNSDLTIIESTYSKDEETQAKEYNHMTSTHAAETAKKAKAKQLILTHISQRYEHNEKQLLKEAKSVFNNTLIARDFMSVEV